MFACCLQPTDGTAGRAHALGHLFLDQLCLLSGIEELAQVAKLSSCFLPRRRIARELGCACLLSLVIARKGLVGEVSHGIGTYQRFTYLKRCLAFASSCLGVF